MPYRRPWLDYVGTNCIKSPAYHHGQWLGERPSAANAACPNSGMRAPSSTAMIVRIARALDRYRVSGAKTRTTVRSARRVVTLRVLVATEDVGLDRGSVPMRCIGRLRRTRGARVIFSFCYMDFDSGYGWRWFGETLLRELGVSMLLQYNSSKQLNNLHSNPHPQRTLR